MALVLIILALAVLLLVTEWVASEIVALLVLLALTLAGVIDQSQALLGFSNPAVITIASVLVLGGGLSRTGVAAAIGRTILSFSGDSETRLTVLMMLTVGVLSGLINDVGVAALMLPVVLEVARRLGRSPSKLLIPLAFASLLGGMTTAIGTNPNILVSGALRDRGMNTFEMFDFTPVGAAALSVGILYMVFWGNRILPDRDLPRQTGRPGKRDLKGLYGVDKVLFALKVPGGSRLAGKTVAQCRLGSALQAILLAVVRRERPLLAPGPETVLREGDRLWMEGRPERLEALKGWELLRLESGGDLVDQMGEADVEVAEVEVAGEASIAGKSLAQTSLRSRHGATVMALRRQDEVHYSDLLGVHLLGGDRLLLIGPQGLSQGLSERDGFVNVSRLQPREAVERYGLQRRLLRVKVPEGSLLAGKMLAATRLGDAFGLTVLGITREGHTQFVPDPESELLEGDSLLIEGRPEDLQTLDALRRLEVERDLPPSNLKSLESEDVGLAEAMLSPRSDLAGKTLREAHFRERFGLTVVAVWREGRALTSGLRDIQLRLGDAFLVYGNRHRLGMLAEEPDFILLSEQARKALRDQKAPLCLGIMAAFLLMVSMDWLPIFLAAPMGAVAMIIGGCLRLEEAYAAVEWKAVIMVGGMLSMGLAMEESGTAAFLADSMLGWVAPWGPHAVAGGLFLITAMAAQVMPASAVAVLMAPIALSSGDELGLSVRALLMVVAVGSSCSFLTPTAHPVNLLVMGMGGYRFRDYGRVGLPLLVLMFAVAVLVLPLVWPLQ
ncbi:MAG TPA: SLC13 family permease [Acidobacteriota bacterium]|nr:SLC13 family permease [Acidobacteriota bacterium]